MENLELINENWKVIFSGPDKDNDIEIEVEDYNGNSICQYISKENIIELKYYLERVLKIMASNV